MGKERRGSSDLETNIIRSDPTKKAPPPKALFIFSESVEYRFQILHSFESTLCGKPYFYSVSHVVTSFLVSLSFIPNPGRLLYSTIVVLLYCTYFPFFYSGHKMPYRE